MSNARKPLYERLPEIYRQHDLEQSPPGQLQAFVSILDEVYSAIHANIELLYHDFFIETCDDWVIPYIADLLGTSHLSGDSWTLRADVSRTVHHRRRKGTLGAIESLTFALSGWAAHAVEMRERLLWHQHLNHQRPDEGGAPPLSRRTSARDAVRGGVVTLRDPALLSLVGGAFDPFGRVVDVKPPQGGFSGWNLPNLAIFLWRLQDYTVPVSKPVSPLAPNDIIDLTPAAVGNAAYSVRIELHPMAEPMVLFNTHRFRADDDPPELSSLDAVPGPMPPARLTQDTPAGRHDQYVEVQLYSVAPPPAPGARALGLTLHVPQAPFTTTNWKFRGANLCAWEAGLHPPLREYEIVIDPERGRVVFGVMDETNEAEPLRDELLVSATYGFSGPSGAQPVARPATASTWLGQTPTVIPVNYHISSTGLRDALANLSASNPPLVVEIQDSMTHDLDLAGVVGIGDEGGKKVLRLGRSLWIRAKSGERPVIRLTRPLAFRPHDVLGPGAAAFMSQLTVKLEGLYLTHGPGFGAADTLIERAALNQLIVEGCTLDPGGSVALNGTRQPIRDAMKLTNDYGFTNLAEETAFDQTPEIIVSRSICGPLALDSDYSLRLLGSIVDAGSGVSAASSALAIHAASGDPETQWGPELVIKGLSCFGRTRVESATGEGGIFVQRLEAHDNQKGCIKFSYFSGNSDRLPPHHGSVFGTQAWLAFTSEIFGQAGYAQLRQDSDRKILENGPGYDQMGAFGYLQNTHKRKNIQIRYREFMPVGVRPVLITVT